MDASNQRSGDDERGSESAMLNVTVESWELEFWVCDAGVEEAGVSKTQVQYSKVLNYCPHLDKGHIKGALRALGDSLWVCT